MNKYRENYMEELTKTACTIMRKPELTEQDKMFLLNYKRELRRYEYKPFLQTCIGYAEQAIAFLKHNLEDEDIKEDNSNGI